MSIIFNIIESKSTVNVVNDFVRITVADGVSVDTVNSLIDDKLAKENIIGLKLADSPEFADELITPLALEATYTPTVWAYLVGIFTSVPKSVKSHIVKIWSILHLKPTGNQGDIIESNIGNNRGINATDFQFYRDNIDEIASTNGSFIAGGKSNKISSIINRASLATYAHCEGFKNRVHDWYGHAEGSGCISDGKISHAEGNGSICSGNDSHVEGNRSVCGRKYYPNITSGSEDAGDGLGILQYIIIPDIEGDVSGYFPNALFDSSFILTTYGIGAQKDSVGNIYASGFIPAIWSGVTLVTENDLKWALHRITIIRGSHENDLAYITIAKATYSSGTGTKVYYYESKPYTSLIGIYSSYAPTVRINGLQLGNGLHAEGLFSSAVGYGSHAEGHSSRAWNTAAHAEGYYSEALGAYSHSQNNNTQALGDNSTSLGINSVALRRNQISYSSGKRVVNGDDQIIKINYSHTCNGVGWFELYLLTDLESGKTYHFDTMVIGVQYGGIAGAVGDSFAYRFKGIFQKNGETYTIIGTPTRELIGRSSTMSGDGLASGIRVSFYGRYPTQNRIILRYDGLADTTYRVQISSNIQELRFN